MFCFISLILATVPEYVCWFSIIHNGRNLIKYDKNNDLNIFNGLKAGPMVMLLFAHKYIFYASQPVSYPKRAETVIRIIITNAKLYK